MQSVHLSVARGRLVLQEQASISALNGHFVTLAGGHSPGCSRLICDLFACPTQVLDAKSKAEEAAATAAAALSAAKRKAKQYRGDNTALLSDYDTWVQNLLAKQSNSGSGGTGTAVLSGRCVSSLVNNSSGAGAAAAAAPAQGSWAGGLQSPVWDGRLSRNASLLASPATALPPAGPGADADLERYDRIAALLETRGVSASLSRVLSAGRHSPLPSPGHSAAGGPGTSVAGGHRISRATSGASPKPSFK